MDSFEPDLANNYSSWQHTTLISSGQKIFFQLLYILLVCFQSHSDRIWKVSSQSENIFQKWHVASWNFLNYFIWKILNGINQSQSIWRHWPVSKEVPSTSQLRFSSEIRKNMLKIGYSLEKRKKRWFFLVRLEAKFQMDFFMVSDCLRQRFLVHLRPTDPKEPIPSFLDLYLPNKFVRSPDMIPLK